MKRFLAAAALALALGSGVQAQEPVTGKAAETFNSGGYTYVRVENAGRSTWVAVPQIKVAKGEKVSFAAGMVMQGFKSKPLNRTFDSIVFSPGPSDDAAAASGRLLLEKRTVSPRGGAPKLAKDAGVKTAKAAGPDAYTVAELHAKRAELAGKRASVRGKVVKVSREILGVNWVHLQDGTGDATAGTHDLTVTTGEDAKVGETLTASGSVAKDKDFGAGYRYSVLLEKAAFKR
ncbi:MAG: DNA-binding protein [Elusimicrobia bacterium]|nr:DNA-binding protein [Elusimicrobiota bacterium]